MTCLAPETLDIAAQRSPTAPAPKIKTVLPVLSAARREPCIATPSGSKIAPNSRDTFGGNLSSQDGLESIGFILTYNSTMRDDLFFLAVCPGSGGMPLQSF